MQAKLSNGVLLKVNTGGSTYVTIPGVQRVNHPGAEYQTPDVTDHDLTDQYDKHILGNFDGAKITFEGNYRINDAIHQILLALAELGTLTSFKIVYPESSLNTCTFFAFPKITGRRLDIKQPMTWQGSLQQEGPAVYT